ncbi:MAG: hypothetical protein PVH04_01095 [Gammaproteobacteria bacterium]
MKYNNQRSTFTGIIRFIFFMLIMASLFACASSPDTESGETAAAESETAGGSADATSGGDTATTTAAVSPAADTATTPAEPAVEPEQTKPPRIVETCKDEPYTKYEQQARDSIAKGLQATKADKFGVGFRDVNEHNKWSKMHNELFKEVNEACKALSECAKKHPDDKITECNGQARIFDEWQKLAKNFAEKAKTVETTQPPKICSLTPDLSDPERCFHGLADNIDKACDSDACQETSDCWDGVGFLDAAIIQAERSCGFVHEDLSKCRGYVEATNRRKRKFDQCQDLQGRLTITIYPVL